MDTDNGMVKAWGEGGLGQGAGQAKGINWEKRGHM